MDLAALLRDPDTQLSALTAGLDALDHAGRVRALEGCGATEMGRLYDLAASAPPIDEAHFVGEAGSGQPVAHDGWNSLPLPAIARRFQKVFARPEAGGAPRLFGYNASPLRWAIGPGYFQLVPTAGNAEFEARGAWVVDYHLIPDGPVPAGWPWVVPNWVGPQVLIYSGTRDFMRRVSQHVCVGKPWARTGSLPFCFSLTRVA